MHNYLNLEYVFVASFGRSRTGKTVTAEILDADGVAKVGGYTVGTVYELTDGSYGVKITFTSAFAGSVKWSNTTDGIELYNSFNAIADYRADITNILKIEKNKWEVASDQLIIYDDDGTTPLYTFDLTPDDDTPTTRTPA